MNNCARKWHFSLSTPIYFRLKVAIYAVPIVLRLNWFFPALLYVANEVAMETADSTRLWNAWLSMQRFLKLAVVQVATNKREDPRGFLSTFFGAIKPPQDLLQNEL